MRRAATKKKTPKMSGHFRRRGCTAEFVYALWIDLAGTTESGGETAIVFWHIRFRFCLVNTVIDGRA